jgi:hypothetical protein
MSFHTHFKWFSMTKWSQFVKEKWTSLASFSKVMGHTGRFSGITNYSNPLINFKALGHRSLMFSCIFVIFLDYCIYLARIKKIQKVIRIPWLSLTFQWKSKNSMSFQKDVHFSWLSMIFQVSMTSGNPERVCEIKLPISKNIILPIFNSLTNLEFYRSHIE